MDSNTYQARFIGGDPLFADYTPGADVAAGDVVVQATLPGVAHMALSNGVTGALAVGGGIYILACAAAIAAGDTVWWDDTNNRVTETATSNTHFGVALAASYSSNTKVIVKHDPQGVVGVIF